MRQISGQQLAIFRRERFLYGYAAHQDIEIIAYVPDEYRIYLFYDVDG